MSASRAHPPARPVALDAGVRWVDYTDPLVRPMLVELDHEYGARYGHTLGDLDEEMRRERERFGPPDGGLVLLLDGERPVSGGAFRRWDPDTAELKRIWTDHAYRRLGLARRVLVELEREIAVRGYRRIFLTTGPLQPEAQNLYLDTGYTPLYDRSLPAERIGKHPFEKAVRRTVRRPTAPPGSVVTADSSTSPSATARDSTSSPQT